MGKPLLLLQSRPEDLASDNEYASYLKVMKVSSDELERVRIDRGESPLLSISEYSGIIMAGGPANYAYDDAQKNDLQRSLEPVIAKVLDEVVENDLPFMGVCLGMGALVTHQGGHVSFDFGEQSGVVDVNITEEASSDQIMKYMSPTFRAIVGHKEGASDLPSDAVVLARSEKCVQMIRVKNNIYAVQFHPETDTQDFAERLRIYKDAGYCDPEEMESILERAAGEDVSVSLQVLSRFAEIFGR